MVLTDANLEEAKRVDTYCHAHGIRFIYAVTRGVFAHVFTDFGPSFTVIDTDGEQRTKAVKHIAARFSQGAARFSEPRSVSTSAEML